MLHSCLTTFLTISNFARMLSCSQLPCPPLLNTSFTPLSTFLRSARSTVDTRARNFDGKSGRLYSKKLRLLRTSRQGMMLSLQQLQWTRPNNSTILFQMNGKPNMTTRAMSKELGQSGDFDGQAHLKSVTKIGRKRGIDAACPSQVFPCDMPPQSIQII